MATVIAVGSAIDGVELWGPFEDGDEALRCADTGVFGDEPWWIAELHKPEDVSWHG